MKFKRGIPTEPGFYWIKIPKRFAMFDDEISVRKICLFGGRIAIGNNILEGWSVYEEALYAGPIAPPEEE